MNVRTELVKVLKLIPSYLSDTLEEPQHSYFLRLSSVELKKFSRFVGATTCTQVQTSRLIVLTDKNKFWKVVIHSHEMCNVLSLYGGSCCKM